MTAITENLAPAAKPVNRSMVLAAMMLGTILVALDQTIANVALPHIAGSVSASQEQIGWVLTSYIVAGAIVTPLTGWLTDRFGYKLLFLMSIGGFIAASALCGAAQNLGQIVAFRIIQGVMGAPLMPLSQALILDLYDANERGPAMGTWSMGATAAPIIGPVLGGWLTDSASWRWCFYINLPVGALALLGVLAFVPGGKRSSGRKLDLSGFAYLAIAVASLQLMFDRGQGQGWFESPEIVIYAAVAFLGAWFTLIHSVTHKTPFVRLRIFADRNFAASSMMSFMLALVLFSSVALVPLMCQTVLGLSSMQSGLLAMPRGVGSVISMLIMGPYVTRMDPRMSIIAGLVVFVFNFFYMSHFTLDTSQFSIGLAGFIQGVCTSFIFLPMATMGFTTLPADLRGDATAFGNLMRNLGGSAGISIMLALQTNNATHARASLVEPYSLDNGALVQQALPAPMSLTDPMGVALLSSEVDRQAAMVGYTSVFLLIAVIGIFMMGLPLMLRKSTRPSASSDDAEPIILE